MLPPEYGTRPAGSGHVDTRTSRGCKALFHRRQSCQRRPFATTVTTTATSPSPLAIVDARRRGSFGLPHAVIPGKKRNLPVGDDARHRRIRLLWLHADPGDVVHRPVTAVLSQRLVRAARDFRRQALLAPARIGIYGRRQLQVKGAPREGTDVPPTGVVVVVVQVGAFVSVGVGDGVGPPGEL